MILRLHGALSTAVVQFGCRLLLGDGDRAGPKCWDTKKEVPATKHELTYPRASFAVFALRALRVSRVANDGEMMHMIREEFRGCVLMFVYVGVR